MDLNIKIDLAVASPPSDSITSADPFGKTSRREPIDLRRAECPYCHGSLKKVPAAKTKCPYCGCFMFVRTRPDDFSRVVVTSAQADQIEADYRILTGAREPDFRYITTESEVQTEKRRLKESFRSTRTSEPSDDEVKWTLLNQKAVKHASDLDFGLSRNVYMTMAEFLVRRWRLREALGLYVYVCICDLNGAQNLGGLRSGVLTQPSAFDPNQADVAPVVLDQITRIAKYLRFDKHALRAVAASQYASIFPLSSDQCWHFVENAIWPDLSSLRNPLCNPDNGARRPQSGEIEQIVNLPAGRRTTIWRDATAAFSLVNNLSTDDSNVIS